MQKVVNYACSASQAPSLQILVQLHVTYATLHYLVQMFRRDRVQPVREASMLMELMEVLRVAAVLLAKPIMTHLVCVKLVLLVDLMTCLVVTAVTAQLDTLRE